MGLVTERTPEVFIMRTMRVRFHLTGEFRDVLITDVTAEALIHGTSRIRKIRFMAGSAIRSIGGVLMIQIVGRGPGEIVRRHFFYQRLFNFSPFIILQSDETKYCVFICSVARPAVFNGTFAGVMGKVYYSVERFALAGCQFRVTGQAFSKIVIFHRQVHFGQYGLKWVMTAIAGANSLFLR